MNDVGAVVSGGGGAGSGAGTGRAVTIASGEPAKLGAGMGSLAGGWVGMGVWAGCGQCMAAPILLAWARLAFQARRVALGMRMPASCRGVRGS